MVYLAIKFVKRVVYLFRCSQSIMHWTVIQFTLTYKLNFGMNYFDASMLLRKPGYWISKIHEQQWLRFPVSRRIKASRGDKKHNVNSKSNRKHTIYFLHVGCFRKKKILSVAFLKDYEVVGIIRELNKLLLLSLE